MTDTHTNNQCASTPIGEAITAEAIARRNDFSITRKAGGWKWSHPVLSDPAQKHRSEDGAWRGACNFFYANNFVRTHKNDPIRLQTKSQQGMPTMPFIVQPIISSTTLQPYGYEILYRGKHPKNWQIVDMTMLRFLSQYSVPQPLFVNLSNQTILSLDERLLFAAHARNTLYLEWSESVIDEVKFERIKFLLSNWAEKGLRIVIDDFGKGRDAFDRLFSFDKVHAIKIDGQLMKTMESNAFARKMMSLVVATCKEKGICTIAECIETPAQFSAMLALGVEQQQGWYIDKLFAGTEKRPVHESNSVLQLR